MCESQDGDGPDGQPTIEGPRGCTLHAVWGKVRAMSEAQRMFPNAKFFAFFDSDVAVHYGPSMMQVTLPDLFERRDLALINIWR